MNISEFEISYPEGESWKQDRADRYKGTVCTLFKEMVHFNPERVKEKLPPKLSIKQNQKYDIAAYVGDEGKIVDFLIVPNGHDEGDTIEIQFSIASFSPRTWVEYLRVKEPTIHYDTANMEGTETLAVIYHKELAISTYGAFELIGFEIPRMKSKNENIAGGAVEGLKGFVSYIRECSFS